MYWRLLPRHSIVVLGFAFCLFSKAPNAAAQSEPTWDDVLQNYVEAIGGAEKLAAAKTLRLEAKHVEHFKNFEYSQSLLVSGKRWITKDSNGSRSGGNGKREWGPSEVKQPQWRELGRYPHSATRPILYSRHLMEFPGKLKYVGSANRQGKTVYRFKVTPPTRSARNRFEVFPSELVFEEESGLLVETKNDCSTVQLSDYRDVDGIMIPFHIRKTGKVADIEFDFDINIESIELNVEIDDEEFETDA